MNRRAWGYVMESTILVLILFALLVAIGSKVGLFPEPTDLRPEASEAILAVVGATAMGIERIIEPRSLVSRWGSAPAPPTS